MKQMAWLLCAALGVALTGCGKQDAAPQAPNVTLSNGQSGASAEGTAAPMVIEAATPDEAVQKFFQAICEGDEVAADSLLTQKAREETARYDLAVKPPGTATARYTVGEVEYVTEAGDGAHVLSEWTDVTAVGEEYYQIVWILRKEAGQWRIAGMATRLFEGDPPLILNFEDPEDMIRQRELAEERMIARLQAEADADADARQAAVPRGDDTQLR